VFDHNFFVFCFEEAQFGLFGFGDVANGERFAFLGVEFGGEEVSEVAHFFVEVDNFEQFVNFESVEAVEGFFLFFLCLEQELFLCELFLDDFLFHGGHPEPLDTLDRVRDYKIGLSSSGRSEYVIDTFFDHMLANGILDLKLEFMVFGDINILLLFAGLRDQVEKVVGLLVSLDFVQLVGDGFAVVERVEDHLSA
jgi:hypothetical protein